MARTRTIKPGFFLNDTLSELDPLCRLLFIGLWTLADREGRLKDAPKRIKVQILPYDDCDIEQYLDELQRYNFIQRYKDSESAFIQIRKFSRHQHPHNNEPPSIFPAPHELPEDEEESSDINEVEALSKKSQVLSEDSESTREDIKVLRLKIKDNKVNPKHSTLIEKDPHLTPKERELFLRLSELANYPFDLKKDKKYIIGLKKEFPSVDVWGTLERWINAKSNDPLPEGGNPRASFRNWVVKDKRINPDYRQELDERFNQFFKPYPNQAGLGEARKLWYRAFPLNMSREKKQQRLENAIAHRDIYIKAQDPRYCKPADNFLRTLDFDHPPIAR